LTGIRRALGESSPHAPREEAYITRSVMTTLTQRRLFDGVVEGHKCFYSRVQQGEKACHNTVGR